MSRPSTPRGSPRVRLQPLPAAPRMSSRPPPAALLSLGHAGGSVPDTPDRPPFAFASAFASASTISSASAYAFASASASASASAFASASASAFASASTISSASAFASASTISSASASASASADTPPRPPSPSSLLLHAPANPRRSPSPSASASRVRPISRQRPWVSAPSDFATAAAVLADLADQHVPTALPAAVYYVLNANGSLNKKPTQRPSSACFSYRFRTPLQTELVFQAFHPPASVERVSDILDGSCVSLAVEEIALGLCRYFEIKHDKYRNMQSCLELGSSSPILPVFLSYFMEKDSRLIIADLPGLCATLGSNSKLNCNRQNVKIELCEFPWDEDEFTGRKAPNVVVINTACFFSQTISPERGVKELWGYIKKLAVFQTKFVVGTHRSQRAIFSNFQRSLNAEFMLQEDLSGVDAHFRDVQIFTLQRRFLPKINSN